MKKILMTVLPIGAVTLFAFGVVSYIQAQDSEPDPWTQQEVQDCIDWWADHGVTPVATPTLTEDGKWTYEGTGAFQGFGEKCN